MKKEFYKNIFLEVYNIKGNIFLSFGYEKVFYNYRTVTKPSKGLYLNSETIRIIDIDEYFFFTAYKDIKILKH